MMRRSGAFLCSRVTQSVRGRRNEAAGNLATVRRRWSLLSQAAFRTHDRPDQRGETPVILPEPSRHQTKQVISAMLAANMCGIDLLTDVQWATFQFELQSALVFPLVLVGPNAVPLRHQLATYQDPHTRPLRFLRGDGSRIDVPAGMVPEDDSGSRIASRRPWHRPRSPDARR